MKKKDKEIGIGSLGLAKKEKKRFGKTGENPLYKKEKERLGKPLSKKE